MSEYDGEKRPLPWDLQNALVFSQTTEDDEDCESPSSFVWPEDSDERVPILFNLSLNEYNVLSSTIDVGSDIAYGADALRVMWLWLRNMRCPVSLCDLFIDCVNTNDLLISRIGIRLLSDPEFMGNMLEFMSLELPADENFMRRISAELLGDPEFSDTIYDNLPPNTQTGNSYPPLPVAGDDACKAATEIVNRIRDLIVDVYADLASIDPDDVLLALLNQQGWNALELVNLVNEQQASLANEMDILAAFDADKDDMICQLKNHALNQEFILSWVDTAFATYTAVRPIVRAAVNAAATDGRWSLWATIGMATGTGECPEDCDTPELALVLNGDFASSTLVFIETTADGDVYELTVSDAPHYLKLAVISVGSVPFYIVNVEEIAPATFGTNIQMGGGTYAPDNVPCWVPTTYVNLYLSSSEPDQMETGDKLRITIAHEPCHEVFLRPRVDGDWGGSSFSITFIGFDGSGNVIYDVTNTSASGNMKVGFDTVTEGLSTLKSAYLVSAVPTSGTIGFWSHEQADRSGVVGVGASGTVSSKKWAFYGLPGYNIPVRVVLSDHPY